MNTARSDISVRVPVPQQQYQLLQPQAGLGVPPGDTVVVMLVFCAQFYTD